MVPRETVRSLFPRVPMFPEMKSRETSGLEGKQKLSTFHREHTLNALIYI